MIRTTLLAADHVDVLSAQLRLALLLQDEGRADEAAAAGGRCLARLLDAPELRAPADAGDDGQDGGGSGGGTGGGGRVRSPLVATALHALGSLALQVRPSPSPPGSLPHPVRFSFLRDRRQNDSEPSNLQNMLMDIMIVLVRHHRVVHVPSHPPPFLHPSILA